MVPDGTMEMPLQLNWYVQREDERTQMSDADHVFVDAFRFRQIIGSCLLPISCYMLCTRVVNAVNY